MIGNGNGHGGNVWRWALGVAGAVIALLVTLGANAQLRRLDAVETRLLELERAVTRLDALAESAHGRRAPTADVLRERLLP